MALVFTLAGLQTQLDSIATHIDNSAWASALAGCAKANAVLAGLPASAQSDTQTVTMRQDLRAMTDLIIAARAASPRDARRLIRANVRPQTSFPGKTQPPTQGDFIR